MRWDLIGRTKQMTVSLDGLFDLEQSGYCTQIAGYSHALHPQCSDISKYLYKKVFSLFERYGLGYFAFAGVLLGYVRNQSMPPWLDDMDVMIFEEDFEKFDGPYFINWTFQWKLIPSVGEKLITGFLDSSDDDRLSAKMFVPV